MHASTPEPAIVQLRSHWAAQRRLRLNPGASLAKVRAFETEQKVRLPVDFSAYLQAFDGFATDGGPNSPLETDDEGFEFFSLERLTPICLIGTYYEFSCWTLGLLSFGICLNAGRNNGQVVSVRNDLHVVAHSFSEFVELYIEDSMRLYEPSSLRAESGEA